MSDKSLQVNIVAKPLVREVVRLKSQCLSQAQLETSWSLCPLRVALIVFHAGDQSHRGVCAYFA